jgi:hypothetical protein
VADGLAAIDSILERLRKLPGIARRAAPNVARVVERELRSQIAAGSAPDGTPWQETQDGRQPLRNAGSALSVRAVGTVVLAKIEGVYARHHRGWVRGGVRRPILPSAKAPEPIVRAVREVVADEFRETMRGAR